MCIFIDLQKAFSQMNLKFVLFTDDTGIIILE